jgi:uncharacterized protein HemX
MLADVLAQGSGGGGGGGGLSATTVYYIIASIATAIGVVYGGVRFYNRQRDHWTQEGVQRAEQATAVKLNTSKLEENTNAVAALTHELREFVVSVRIELEGHEGRITRLERWRELHGQEQRNGREEGKP